MKRPRITIGRLMFVILVIGMDAALIRAFFEGMFSGVILLFFAMQIGLFLACFKARWRARAKSPLFLGSGLDVAGIAVVLVLFSCEFFPDSASSRCVSAYHRLCDGHGGRNRLSHACIRCRLSDDAPRSTLRGGVFRPGTRDGLAGRVVGHAGRPRAATLGLEPDSSPSSLSATFRRVNFESSRSRLTGPSWQSLARPPKKQRRELRSIQLAEIAAMMTSEEGAR